MDQPNCHGSIALEAQRQALYEDKVGEIIDKSTEKSTRIMQGVVGYYDNRISKVTKILTKLGFCHEPTRVTAYRTLLDDEKCLLYHENRKNTKERFERLCQESIERGRVYLERFLQ